MVKRSGLTRGDHRRNQRIAGLRSLVRTDRAILAIDLGEDKQAAALMDHEGRVLGRRTVAVKAHALGGLLTWAGGMAARQGFAGVVVGCEPTGHRWRSVMGLADVAGIAVYLAREADDYTRDKTDHKDAVVIGRLISRLDCYLPERADEDWARLRHLGVRRSRLVGDVVAYGRQIGDLLSCSWPAVLSCAAKPLRSTTWLACLAATVAGGDGDLARLRQLGRDEFLAAARRQLTRFGAKRLCHRVARQFFDALTDEAGVTSQRRGALERVYFLLEDWSAALVGLDDVETRMVGVLDTKGLTQLASSIPGVSAIGAAMILAETGDLTRFASARSVVKHAGLNPCENTSATFRGITRVSRRGRPRLRAAAWRAMWAALPHNPVLANKFTHLTTREHDRLTPAEARVACAAALLRWLHAIITRQHTWDATIAAGTPQTRNPILATAA